MKQIFGIDIPRTLEDVYQPGRLALLVYDMQVGIKSQVKDAELIVERGLGRLRLRAGRGFASFLPGHELAQGGHEDASQTIPGQLGFPW
jgi:biuret amidohydrolase